MVAFWLHCASPDSRCQYAITKASAGTSYAPPICGSLRSLYRKLPPLRWSQVAGVKPNLLRVYTWRSMDAVIPMLSWLCHLKIKPRTTSLMVLLLAMPERRAPRICGVLHGESLINWTLSQI